MKPDRAARTMLAAAALLGAAWIWTTPAIAGEMTAAQASEIARQQTGGRVLAVKATDGGFQVKVLTPDGKVRYVFVPSR